MSDFSSPTQAEVVEAMRFIPSPQLRRVFFDGLNNPNWVLPLFRAGQFASPPEPVVDDEGYTRDMPWPEVDYLVRMAPLAPDEVINVFLSLTETQNPWVRHSVISVGANLPAEKAVQLKPLLEKWESTGFGYRTDPRALAMLARNLLTGPKPAVGRRLARAIFGPLSVDDQGQVRTTLEEYWYEEELPGILEALGDSALEQVVRWLKDWERLAGRLDHERGYTSISRPSIETNTRAHAGIEDALIDGVRDAALALMQRDPVAAIATLVESDLFVAKRIALFAAARAIAAEVAEAPKVIDASIGLLEDPVFADPHFRLELADYFRAIADVAPHRLVTLAGYLDRGPFGDQLRLTDRLRLEGDTDGEAEMRAVKYAIRWRHRLLATIGSQHLSEALGTQLEALEESEGAIENPTKPDFQMTSWVGTESALSLDDLSAMGPSDLVAYLAAWHPEAGSWHGPSHGGQGRLLTTVLTTSPRALEGEFDLVKRLRPTYVNAILRGWEAAIQGDADPDWPQLIGLVRDVLGHPDLSTFDPEGDDFDDDRDYSRARHAAVAFIEEAVKVREEPRVSSETVDALGRILLDNVADARFWDDYVSSEPGDGWDPLNLSINSAWSIQARALIGLAGSSTNKTIRAEALARIDDERERDDPYDALSAVIGESLARLYLADETWLRVRVESLFGSEESISRSQQVALSTALATQFVHSVTLGLVRGAVIAAMKLDQPMAVGWHGLRPPDQLIGEWIITTHIRGQLDLNDALTVTFFSDESADIRGDAIGHLAWEFMHAEVVDEEIRTRLEALWDSRVAHVRDHLEDRAELKDFYWFVRSGKFAREWWVPRLVEAANLHPNLMTHGMIGKELAEAAPEYSNEVLDAVIALSGASGGPREPTMYDLMTYAVPAALAWALASRDPDLQVKARRFMNALAERGHINVQSEVEAVDTTSPSGG